MIKPSVSRIVWFHPHIDEGHNVLGQPHAAIVVHVLDDRTVNLAVFNETGALYSRQAVQLLQDDDAAPPTGHFAMWMPFQLGQAKKTEAAEGGAGTVQLQPVHDRIDNVEKDVQFKFVDMGDWLTVKFSDLEARLAALATRADPPPIAAATEAHSDAGATGEAAKAAETTA